MENTERLLKIKGALYNVAVGDAMDWKTESATQMSA